MKKQIKKLILNKKTISNLNASEMNQYVGGGSSTCGCPTDWVRGCGGTKNGKTCPGHNTCYTC